MLAEVRRGSVGVGVSSWRFGREAHDSPQTYWDEDVYQNYLHVCIQQHSQHAIYLRQEWVLI